MQVELKGVVKVIFAEQKINDKLDRKDIVITVDTDTQYPQDIICQAINKRIELINSIKMGDTVVVKCNLRGKGTNGKYYNQLDVWDIIKL
jgi:hypothetical protein